MNELTVNDYLDNLELDRQDMINSLKSKGMEISDSATFTEIVPKIDGLVDINGYYDTTTKKTSGSIISYIKQIPMIDTSNYTDMSSIFKDYKSLTTIPQLDTSKVTSMNQMFSRCTLLTTISLLDTSKVTDMGMMFRECKSLTTIPLLDTSNVKYMNDMFYHCDSLTEIPQLDTSNVIMMNYMFGYCPKLTTIPQLDASNVTSVGSMFYLCGVQTLGGLINLGQAYDTTQSANYSSYTLNLSYSKNITHDSLMNVINNLYDIATKGCQPQSLVLGSENLAKLTADEIAIATNKGWNIVA